MSKKLLVVFSLLLVFTMVSSQVFAATKTADSDAKTAKKAELVAIVVDGKCFVFPKDADPELVISEINRVLGVDMVTSLDQYAKSDAPSENSLLSEPPRWVQAFIPYAELAMGIAALNQITITVQQGQGPIYYLYQGIMHMITNGTGYVPGQYYYLYPIFDIVDGLVNWY